MVIKFYGYDDAGNLVQAGKAGNQNGSASAASPRATVQKIYPFSIKGFDFRIANRIVEYKITATCPIYQLNASTRRGSIPAQFELVGKTVGDILEGNGSTGTSVSTGGTTPTGTGNKAESGDAKTAGRKTTPTVQEAPKGPTLSAEEMRIFASTGRLPAGKTKQTGISNDGWGEG